MANTNLVAMDGFSGTVKVTRFQDGDIVLAFYDSIEPDPLRRRMIVHLHQREAAQLAHDIVLVCMESPVADRAPMPEPAATDAPAPAPAQVY